MGNAGTPHGRFQRAIERGNLMAADAAARELGSLGLGDALRLCLLFGREGDRRYERAAVRWHARFALEAGGLGFEGSQLALALLAGPREAGDLFALRRLAERYSGRL